MDERRDDTSSGRAQGAAGFPTEGKASRETMDERRETGDEVKREERKEKREETGDERRETGDEVKREERKEKREETGGNTGEDGTETGEMKTKAGEAGKKKRREIPWKEIREEYVAHGGSYRELGTKYGIPFTQIGRRGRQENWTELRAAADYKAMTETISRASRARARANLDALKNLNLLTAKLRNYCEEMLDDPTQRGKVLSSGRDWDGLAGMLERIEGIERRMMDIQSEAERRAEKREEKKLRLSEKKASVAEGPQEIRVVMANGDDFAG